MSASAEVQRIVRTGTVWFGCGLVAFAAFLGELLGHGWRIQSTVEPWTALWWLALVTITVGLGCLCWAGCPALGGDFGPAHRQKVRCIRAGAGMFLAGLVVMTIVIATSPGLPVTSG